MVPAGFGWSAGDIIKLIEVSVVVYQAFNDARKNSSRQFQLLSDEFGRFHTCLELLQNLLEEHTKKLYFGYDQFKTTLEECQEFLQKYSVLGDRRNSVVKFFKTIGWTTEEKGTINRLMTAVHGHAHVIGLYTGYMTLKTSLEQRAVNERLHQETLEELRLLRREPSISCMPFITEEPEGPVTQDLRAVGSAEHSSVSKLEQVAKELDGFSHLLKRERDSLYSLHQNSQHQNDGGTVSSEIMKEDEAESVDMDVTLLQTMLQEVEQKLERARNGSKRQYNQHVIRGYCRQNTHDSGISDVSASPNSRYISLLSTSPTIHVRSGVPVPQRSSRASLEIANLIPENHQPSLQRQLSTSPTSSPLLGSSPPTTRRGTGTNTAATTPMFNSPVWSSHTGTRPPSISLPSAAADWSLFCSEAQVICEGWSKPWPCNISQRRRMRDGGFSLRAEQADGSCLYHDLPALGIAVPHTSHTGANPQTKNTVIFKEPHGHKLRKVPSHGEGPEREPRYIFENPADHKAFQELIYGCDLEDSWNITSIKSDREKEESVTQTLRLWRDSHTQIPVILFYTNKRKRSAKTYIQEPRTSFTEKPKADKKKPIVQLNFKRLERVGSVGSGGSSVRSDPSGRTSTDKASHLQWIEIEFGNLTDRDKFLSLWQG